MKEFDIKSAVEFMEEYVKTYREQEGWLTYHEHTWINDMLYAIGVSLDDKEYQFYDGFNKFKQKLLDEGYME